MIFQNSIQKSAIYIFFDICGFTNWSKKYQLEIKDLLDITYSSAYDIFNEKKERNYIKRVVKFLGDGFFAVNEYDDQINNDLLKSFNASISNCIDYIINFNDKKNRSNLHDKDTLGICAGISYGKSERFSLPGLSYDYAGDRINFASRLCGASSDNQIFIEKDFHQFVRYFNTTHIDGIREEEHELKSFGKIKVIKLSIIPF